MRHLIGREYEAVLEQRLLTLTLTLTLTPNPDPNPNPKPNPNPNPNPNPSPNPNPDPNPNPNQVLEQRLRDIGAPHTTEGDARQSGSFKTPDALLPVPLLVGGPNPNPHPHPHPHPHPNPNSNPPDGRPRRGTCRAPAVHLPCPHSAARHARAVPQTPTYLLAYRATCPIGAWRPH